MAWWILGGIALLIALLCLTRLGVHVTFGGVGTTVDFVVGFLKFQAVPAKPCKRKAPIEKKLKKEAKDVANATKMLPQITLEDIKSAVRVMLPACKRALRRTRRGIRIHPLRLSATIGGGEDAAWAAEAYGYAQAVLWTVMPPLEELLVIPDPHIHIGLDFDAANTRVEGEAGVSIRIGTLLALGFGMGIPALRWFLSYRKQEKQKPPSAKETAAA